MRALLFDTSAPEGDRRWAIACGGIVELLPVVRWREIPDAPPWMRGVGALARPLYDFAGLRAFKAKFAPAGWEPVYVTHPRDVRTPVAVLDALRAFAGENLLGFALRTMTETYASV